MATITSNTFLDGGTARTAGETWTINGGVLTIRTDTRVHANAPASMTGSIGATTISTTLGGGVMIDATKVRWLPYNTGSGNAPAIGTAITQGGVSGYLLGVWTDLQSAPKAVGAAIDATGFIKLREVTGGAYSAGALGGINANATGPDVTGWIEVVQRQTAANTVPRLGSFKTRGNWFYLDNTNGSAGQVIKTPTNGGGAGTYVPAVWIETAPNSNVFEIYPAIKNTWFIPANISTDARGKFVESMPNGEIRIGSNGTNNVGFVPPSGCRVRIPNIIGRQSTSAGGDAVNQVPNATLTNRPRFTTTSAGEIDFEYFMNDWYLLFTSPYKVRLVNNATFDIVSYSNVASPDYLDNVVTGSYLGGSIPLTLTSNALGGEIKNSKFFRSDAASNGHASAITTSLDYTFTNCHFGVITYARSTGHAVSGSQCTNIDFNSCYIYCGALTLATCFDININDLDYTDRLVGETNSTVGKYVVSVNTSSDNILVNGLKFGLNGAISNVNPYLAVFYSINSSNILFKNAGTRASPLSVKSSAEPAYAVHDAGVNTNLTAKRIFLQGTRTNVIFTTNTSKNVTFENVHGSVGAVQLLSLNTVAKGLRATSNSVVGGASVYGTHFYDMFTSDNYGRLVLAFNEPTTFNQRYYSATLGTGAGFTSAGQLSMPNVGDKVIFETPYFIKGHNAFSSEIVPAATGTNPQYFNYEYRLKNYGVMYGSELDQEYPEEWQRLFSCRVRTGGGGNGSDNFTIATDPTSYEPQVGDYVGNALGTKFPVGCTVLDITDNVVTISDTLTAALSSNELIYFWSPSEGLSAEYIENPEKGFKMQFKVTTSDANATNALTYISIGTTSSLTEQEYLYPEFSNSRKLEITGVWGQTEVFLFDLNNTNPNFSDPETDYYFILLDSKVIDVPSNSAGTYTYNYTWEGISSNLSVGVLLWRADKKVKTMNILLSDADQSFVGGQENDTLYNASATGKVVIDSLNGIITMSDVFETISIQEIYTGWKDWYKLKDNSFAWVSGTTLEYLGGNTISGSISIPYYLFIPSAWFLRPYDSSYTLSVTNGILVRTGGGSEIFIDTESPNNVRINYQQPVQAIVVATGGSSGGATAAEVWSYGSRSLTDKANFSLSSAGITAVQNGLATGASITALNNLSAAQVKTEVDTALEEYGGPTKAELDSAQTSIEAKVDAIEPGGGGLTADEHDKLMELKNPSLLIDGEIIV